MKKKDKKLLKSSITISTIAILICIICFVYETISKNGNPGFWIIIGLSNLSILLANISNYKKLK